MLVKSEAEKLRVFWKKFSAFLGCSAQKCGAQILKPKKNIRHTNMTSFLLSE